MRQPPFDSWQCATSAVILITALVSSGPGHAADSASPPTNQVPRALIQWTPDASGAHRYFVDAVVRDNAWWNALRMATPADWPGILSVHAGQRGLLDELDLPAMAGHYSVDDQRIRFTPQFPLEPGVNYRAVFRPDHLPGTAGTASVRATSDFLIPPGNRIPSTEVSHIYPSGDVLPENLLKFYIHFSAPMSGGHIYRHIHLRTETGDEVDLPFLELDEELWNPEMTRVTLFIDPGRIKREVRPLEDIGPALEQGKRFTLVIEREWKDAQGNPLRVSHQKPFLVGPPDRESPDPNRWAVTSPARGTRARLYVQFDEPMDHALALRVIQVENPTGELKPGTASITEHEERWWFEPDDPWQQGRHHLVVIPTIEDLAGNNIGKPFEVDLAAGAQRRSIGQPVRIAFGVE